MVSIGGEDGGAAVASGVWKSWMRALLARSMPGRGLRSPKPYSFGEGVGSLGRFWLVIFLVVAEVC